MCTARAKAIQDIKAELDKNGKSFISFRKDLNQTMRNLVKQQLKEQSKL